MKEKYQMPRMETIHVENEGIMAASVNSGDLGDFTGGNPMFSTGTSRSSGNANLKTTSPVQDLEDMINEILTVKK